jgi:2,3-dimethylmalate lyase
MMGEKAARLRAMLDEPTMVLAPFVYDALQARLAEQLGFAALYMTGFGTAAARGYPDLGLLTMSEMVDNVRTIARSVGVPLICDADTGYGNPINVWRTVREYEDAGAAALHIEDQVWPKRCGFLGGKQVIPMDEMVPKVRAACAARRDHNLVIIARSDALAVNGWDDTERRCRAYRAAGADLIFVDGIHTREDLDNYARRLGDLPLLYNGGLMPAEELARYGFKVTIYTGTLFAYYQGIRDTLKELRETGAVRHEDQGKVLEEVLRLLGAPEIDALGKKYGA